MKRGFSLVELSIVLVILGLLVGGILAGQSLIRAAELRAIPTEAARWSSAVYAFRDKYFAIPGDFRDATRFWSWQVNAAHCITNSSAGVSTPGVCDGNGDGIINDGTAGGGGSGEVVQAWRQMALAGLIEGTYTGLAGLSSGNHCNLGTNCPRSKLSQAGWGMYYLANYGGDGSWYELDYGNMFVFGAEYSGAFPATAVLKPEEAWNIDTKMDDGKPAQGKVIGLYWNNMCAAADDGTHADNDYAASYKLSDSAVRCALLFRKAF